MGQKLKLKVVEKNIQLLKYTVLYKGHNKKLINAHIVQEDFVHSALKKHSSSAWRTHLHIQSLKTKQVSSVPKSLF